MRGGAGGRWAVPTDLLEKAGYKLWRKSPRRCGKVSP